MSSPPLPAIPVQLTDFDIERILSWFKYAHGSDPAIIIQVADFELAAYLSQFASTEETETEAAENFQVALMRKH